MSTVIGFDAARSRPPAAAVDTAADLLVDGLTKSFGKFTAVDNISLAVSRYEVKAVIGPNGAGKSTLFSCLAGTLLPTAGTIRLHGQDITLMPAQRRAKRGLVKSFQTSSLFAEMTVQDNVMAAALGVSRWSVKDLLRIPSDRIGAMERVEEALREVRLLSRRNALASTLSHGEQRKLEIAIAIACNARILLLDEPTAGMGIDDIKEFVELVGRLRSRCGLLLVEHNMGVVLGLSDRIIVMAQGRSICEGTPQDVRSDSLVRAAYLGRRDV